MMITKYGIDNQVMPVNICQFFTLNYPAG